MNKPTMPVCHTLEDFIEGFADILGEFDITGISLVLSIQNGACLTTHAYGMSQNELAIGSELIAEYAQGGNTHHNEH